MPKDTEAVVRAVYDAWRVKDLPGAAIYLADDFCHAIHIPPGVHPLGGACHGKEEALRRLDKILADFEFVAYDPGDIIVSGDRAAAQPHIRYVAKVSGETFEATLGHFWTLRDGLVVRLDEYHDMEKVEAFAAKVIAAL